MEELLNFSKSNYLNQLLTEALLNQEQNLTPIYNQIVNNINSLIGWDYLELNQDLTKTISAHFDFNQEQYVDPETLLKYLSHPIKTKQLLILCDFQGMRLDSFSRFLNYYDVLIITHDCFQYLSYGRQLEGVCVINQTDYIDIVDYQQLSAAIESFINEPIFDYD